MLRTYLLVGMKLVAGLSFWVGIAVASMGVSISRAWVLAGAVLCSLGTVHGALSIRDEMDATRYALRALREEQILEPFEVADAHGVLMSGFLSHFAVAVHQCLTALLWAVFAPPSLPRLVGIVIAALSSAWAAFCVGYLMYLGRRGAAEPAGEEASALQ